MNAQQVIELLTNSNVLRTCIYIAGFIIAGWRVGEFIKLQRHHEDTQREINRQNALVQIYKATIEEAATKDMSKAEIKEIFNAVTKCLDEKNNKAHAQNCDVTQSEERNESE